MIPLIALPNAKSLGTVPLSAVPAMCEIMAAVAAVRPAPAAIAVRIAMIMMVGTAIPVSSGTISSTRVPVAHALFPGLLLAKTVTPIAYPEEATGGMEEGTQQAAEMILPRNTEIVIV